MSRSDMNRSAFVLLVILTVFLGACASPARMGMSTDADSGFQFGSVVEKNIFVDASQFRNRTVKTTVRNISGDSAYQMENAVFALNQALAQKNYIPTQAENFGIKLDLNVLYSGRVQQNMSRQFAFLGGAAGGISGHRSDSRGSTAAGVLVGATLGAILGSYVTEDTYIVIAEVSLGVTDSIGGGQGDKRTITFSSSPPLQEEISSGNFRPFREVLRTKVAVFAGGRNVSQYQIQSEVRQRLIRIVNDII